MDYDTGDGEAEGFSIDPDAQADAESTLAEIENIQCEDWDTYYQGLIGQVRGMLDGTEDPADIHTHLEQIRDWLELDVKRDYPPPIETCNYCLYRCPKCR